jgi:hypothetical protein
VAYNGYLHDQHLLTSSLLLHQGKGSHLQKKNQEEEEEAQSRETCPTTQS